ncbi:MAG: hypothetical protein JNL74_03660 [Fibrobacteres bacterium]|nr:hypothetical protein [Fibrobacterota bacterium]
MKSLKAILVLSALLSTSIFADLADDMQKLVGDNAKNYIHPLTNSIGVSMNSGWYNSSKSYSFMKVPVGVQIYFGAGFSMVDDKLKTYDFNGAVATSNLNLGAPLSSQLPDTLRILEPNVPTSVGVKQEKNYTFRALLGQNLDTNSLGLAWTSLHDSVKNKVVLTMPGGLDLDYLPAMPPVVGLNLGLPYKIQLGLRYMPTVEIPELGKIGMLGVKAQYEFTQWIPVIGSLPFVHTSAMYAFNNVNLFDIMKLQNWTSMVNVSADFKFGVGLGVYGGFGVEGSTMKLDYTVPVEYTGLGGTKVELEDKGDNFLKALLGVRLSFTIFDIYGDATFAETNSYHVGVSLGLNGL